MRVIAAALLALAASPALADDCHEKLTAVFAALNDTGPHHVVMTTFEDSGPQTVISDVVPGVGVSAQMIVGDSVERLVVIGERGWIDDETGAWIAMDENMVKFVAQTSDVGAPIIRSSMSNVVCTPEGFSFDIPGAKPLSHVTLTLDAEHRLATLKGEIENVPLEIAYTYDPAITVAAPVAE